MEILDTTERSQQATENLSKVYTTEEIEALKNAMTILNHHGKENAADQIRDVIGDANVCVVPSQSETPDDQTQTDSTTRIMTIKSALIEQKNMMSFGSEVFYDITKRYRIRFDDDSIHVGLTSESWKINPTLDLGEYVYEFQNGMLSRTYWARIPDTSYDERWIEKLIKIVNDVIVESQYRFHNSNEYRKYHFEG